MKYAIIIGTKAEFIKMMPIMREFSLRGIEYLFIHTGQHYIVDLCRVFGVKMPDVVINSRDGFKGDTGGAIGWAIKTLFLLKGQLSAKTDIGHVLVHGDTLSTLIGAIAAKLTGKQLAHVEAGLRSGNLREPFPEEIIRIIVDKISDFKFAPSGKAAARANGVNVGNTSIDALYSALQLSNAPKLVLPEVFALATIHRHENIKSKKRMEQIIMGMSYSQIPVLWFLHENTKIKLKEYGLWPLPKNIVVKTPLEYSQFVYVLRRAGFVFTDGGGISEECAELNIPCIILRKATEREELLDRSDQILTNLDEEIIKLAIMKFSLPRDPYELPNPYDCGGASINIVNFLEGLN